jgi:Spondin_N
MRRFLTPLALAAAAFSAAPLHAQVSPSADYEVSFESTWSDTSHSVPLPPLAHYSPLVGSTHDDTLHLWEPGGMATPGIESMAETGATSTLNAEIDAAILAGSGGTRLNGPTLFTPGTATMDFTAQLTHPRLTLVTMIAPSPDWFVGVDGLNLLENGHWVESVTVDLYAWDSGTDSGTTFTSNDIDTNPQVPIQLVTGGPFFGTTPLGRFVITRKSVATFCDAKVNSKGCRRSVRPVLLR